MLEIMIGLILAPIAVVAVGVTVCLAIGIVKGIIKAFRTK
jgi:hypothetical protein